jgi:hypothetical protein
MQDRGWCRCRGPDGLASLRARALHQASPSEGRVDRPLRDRPPPCNRPPPRDRPTPRLRPALPRRPRPARPPHVPPDPGPPDRLQRQHQPRRRPRGVYGSAGRLGQGPERVRAVGRQRGRPAQAHRHRGRRIRLQRPVDPRRPVAGVSCRRRRARPGPGEPRRQEPPHRAPGRRRRRHSALQLRRQLAGRLGPQPGERT